MLTHRSAIDELAWRYQSAESAIGMRAQDVTEGKGGGVFDDAASHRAHMQHRSDRHRAAVERIRRIDGCLATLEPSDVAVLRVAFTPCARGNLRSRSAFAVVVPPHTVVLVALALYAGIVRDAFLASCEEPPASVDVDRLVWWLDSASDKRLRDLAAETVAALEPRVAAYAAAREAREAREAESRIERRKAREALLERETEALRLRLWGPA